MDEFICDPPCYGNKYLLNQCGDDYSTYYKIGNYIDRYIICQWKINYY